MKFKLFLIGSAVIAACFSLPYLSWGGSFSEMETALDENYLAGEISDDDAYQMLSDIVDQAKITPDPETQKALRGSFRDIVNSYIGSGISSSAAQNLNSVAQD